MLSEIEFGNEIEKLHTAFGIKVTDQIEAKVRQWFDIWKERCRHVALSVLSAMVKKAITNFERMPSFAQFMTLRRAVMGELPIQGYDRTPCSICGGDGVIFAWKNIERFYNATFAFKCHACENWRGKYDGIPTWSGTGGYTIGRPPEETVSKPATAYVPKEIPSVGFPVVDNRDKEQIRRESLQRDRERDDYDAYSDLGFEK